jgi:hypothetical protein
MAEEKEILTILTKEEYDNILRTLEEKFKSSKRVKRLAIQCTDTSRDDLDTRIRITDGEVRLMQKVGKWNSQTREEIEVQIPNKSDVILKIYKIIRNTMTGDKVRTSVIQTDSLLFDGPEYEIKLTHQFGKTDKYNCEIEVLDINLDPAKIASELEIPVNLPEHTAEFWDKWSKEVNFYADDLSDEEIVKLIEGYLK